jgi:hypothetical protein
MAGILIYPLLEALGTSVAITGAAETAGAGIASEIIGTTVTGAIAETIGSGIESGIKTASEYVIGEDNVRNIQDTFNDVVKTAKTTSRQDYFYTAQSFFEGDPTILLNNVKRPIDKNNISPYPGLNPMPDNNYIPVDFSNCNNATNGTSELVKQATASYSPKELANYVTTLSTKLATSEKINVEESVMEIIAMDPSNLGFVQRITNYLATKSIPTSDDYQTLSKIYNGRNIFVPNNYSKSINEKGLIVISGTDELGKTVSMQQTTGVIIPSAHGIFVGPQSINNDLPIDLFDGFAFFHDQEYEERNFADHRADLKFISRLSQNMDRYPSDQLSLINSTIVYFANLGLTIGKLKGSLPANVSTDLIDDNSKDDVFPVMVPEALQLEPREYQVARLNFYKEFEDEMEVASKTSSLFTQVGSGNKFLANEFGSILVQIM